MPLLFGRATPTRFCIAACRRANSPKTRMKIGALSQFNSIQTQVDDIFINLTLKPRTIHA